MTEEQKSYLYFNTNFEVDMFGKLVVKMDADDNYLYTDLSDYTSIINWLIENFIREFKYLTKHTYLNYINY